MNSPDQCEQPTHRDRPDWTGRGRLRGGPPFTPHTFRPNKDWEIEMGLRKTVVPAPAMLGVASAAAAAAIAMAVGGYSGASSETGPRTSAPEAPASPGAPAAPGAPGAPGGPGAAIAAPPPPPAAEAGQTPDPLSPDSATPGAPGPPPEGSCGSVHAENGPNVQVVNVSASGADCAQATRLARDLLARIAGGGPIGSDGALSVSIQGWVCEASARTGATCHHE